MGWLETITRDIRFRIWVTTVVPTSCVFALAAFAVGSVIKVRVARALESGTIPESLIDQVSMADGYIIMSVIWAAVVATAVTTAFMTMGLRRISGISGVARLMATGNFAARVESYSWDSNIARVLTADINSLAESLERTEKLRRDLVADLAHEIRTPLTNLQGYLEAMRDGVIEPRPEALASVHEEVMRLVRLVDALHQLARADAMRNQPFRHRPENLDSLLEPLVELARPAAEARGIRLQLETGTVGRLVPAHADSIVQVMQNLLKNAIQYTAEGGTIIVQTGAGGKLYSFSCINTGSGISDDDLPHIFKRFYRTERAKQGVAGGVGLGLSIARELVQAHGGEMGASSKAGWTTIWFELPLEPATASHDGWLA